MKKFTGSVIVFLKMPQTCKILALRDLEGNLVWDCVICSKLLL